VLTTSLTWHSLLRTIMVAHARARILYTSFLYSTRLCGIRTNSPICGTEAANRLSGRWVTQRDMVFMATFSWAGIEPCYKMRLINVLMTVVESKIVRSFNCTLILLPQAADSPAGLMRKFKAPSTNFQAVTRCSRVPATRR